MSDQTTYYLRSIHRRLIELRDHVTKKRGHQHGLADEALADEIDWLGCYIDSLERKKP